MAAEGPAQVLALTGTTATGKTAIAMELAAEFPVAVISLDSAMIYRGMDIGTAKPTPAELARTPHALVDIRDPAEAYSVADFVADADEAVLAALADGKLPVLVGGTMLYLRAFRDGLAEMPRTDPEVRATLMQEVERRGLPVLYAELAAADPEAARGIHPNNLHRVLRALEVLRGTGVPISAWWSRQSETGLAARLGVRLEALAVLAESREVLHARIAQRFDAMLAAGFVDEVAALRGRGDLTPDLPSMRAVGYRQVWSYLDGAADWSEMRDQGLAATRQLARRQHTWLRGWSWVRSGSAAAIAARARAWAMERAAAVGCA